MLLKGISEGILIEIADLDKDIKELKEKHLIAYCGSKKSGGYFIKPIQEIR